MSVKIAFDFDMTYTRNPNLFSSMAAAFIENHGDASPGGPFDVFIISGRPESQRARTLGEIYLSGVDPKSFTDILLFPKAYEASAFNDNTLKEIAKWKAELCKELKIDMIFEDQSFAVGYIKQVSPDTIVSLIL